MKKETLKPLVTRPSNQGRRKRAEFVKERIYGGVTILALNAGMLAKGGFTAEQAFITIASTIVGLWLASLFASVLSYRIVHDKNMPREEFIHELTIHRGLLFAAVPSLIMFSLAIVGLIAIRTAIIADICLAVIAMTITIFRSGKTRSNSFATAAVSVAVQSAVAGLIIVIKLGAE